MWKVISVVLLRNMFGIDEVATTSSTEQEQVQHEASVSNKNKTIAKPDAATE